MRTIVFVGLLEIAGAIYKISDPAFAQSDFNVQFFGWIFIIAATMDILEFLHKMNQSKSN